MKNINVREYLYHGICGINASEIFDDSIAGSLYIFESMLKTEYIVNTVESKKYKINSKCNIYSDMGYSPRISLGFYPLDQNTFSLSKNLHPNFYGKRIIDKIIMDHNISHEIVDDFVMNCDNLNSGCNSEDYAWRSYYSGVITLLLNKNILEDLKISNYGMLADEICIDEPINLRKYLEYVALGDMELLNSVVHLLEKYNYDIPIISFPFGTIIKDKSENNNTKMFVKK